VVWFVIPLAVLAALRGMWSPCGLSMLTSLNPMAERSRGYRFATSAGWYISGAVIGAAVVGAVCAGGAWLLAQAGLSSPVRLGLGAAAALVGFASDARLFGRGLPDHPRQVNERWLLTYRRWIYAGGFGAQIGFGFATYIMTAAVYGLAVLAVLTANPSAALAIWLTFGLVRGFSILIAADLSTPQRLFARAERIDRSESASRRVLVWAQAVLGVALLAIWWLPAAITAVIVGAIVTALFLAGGRVGRGARAVSREA
jgi:hypothetical protein